MRGDGNGEGQVGFMGSLEVGSVDLIILNQLCAIGVEECRRARCFVDVRRPRFALRFV